MMLNNFIFCTFNESQEYFYILYLIKKCKIPKVLELFHNPEVLPNTNDIKLVHSLVKHEGCYMYSNLKSKRKLFLISLIFDNFIVDTK